MLFPFQADLHIHTCLSPCGGLDMSPRAVVETARSGNLDIIAVCDHNSAANVRAVIRAAARAGGRPTVLPGLEICCAEEVHVLGLFEHPDQAEDLQELIYRRLPGEPNNPEFFGDQIEANEFDEVESFNRRLLIGAVDLGLQALAREIHRRSGLVVAAHVDREAYGLLSVLGFVPPALDLDALEVSRFRTIPAFLAARPELSDRTIIRSSDAHRPEDIGSARTRMLLAGPTFSEVVLAVRSRAGRRVIRAEAPA